MSSSKMNLCHLITPTGHAKTVIKSAIKITNNANKKNRCTL